MPGTGAQGWLGVAAEATSGTWVTPLKFVPFESESIGHVQDTIWRRPIRQSADIVGAVPGNTRIEGDVTMEAFEDIVAQILRGARVNIVKTGTTPNFTYTITGNANAIPAKTLSLTIVRNGIVFGYTGMVVGSFTFTVEDGLLKFNPTFLGRDEAVQAGPFTPTWSSGIQANPYGAGKYKLEIPTSTQIFDADGFEFSIDDSPEAQYRLKDTTAGAQFISYGERTASASITRDFENRTDYDAFKALTSQSITLLGTKGANNSISLGMPAAIKDTYEVGQGGQGELIRANIAYNGVLDATGKAYEIIVKTQEDITLP